LRAAPVTSVLFAACVAVFLVDLIVGKNHWNNETLIHFGAVGRRWVWAGEYWRLFTAMFVHIGPVHIAANLFFGFRLCAMAEKAIGPWRFLVLYLGSGLVGSAVSVLGRDAISAGASGALFGVVGWMLVALRAQFGSWSAFGGILLEKIGCRLCQRPGSFIKKTVDLDSIGDTNCLNSSRAGVLRRKASRCCRRRLLKLVGC